MQTQPGRCCSLSPWAIQTAVPLSFPVCIQHPTYEYKYVMSELANNLQKLLTANFSSREVRRLRFIWNSVMHRHLAGCLHAAVPKDTTVFWFFLNLFFHWHIKVKNTSYSEQWKCLFATALLQFFKNTYVYKTGRASWLFLILGLSSVKTISKLLCRWSKWCNDICSSEWTWGGAASQPSL